MKCMNRNMTNFYYALYEKKTPIVDEYGNYTGEYEIERGNPHLFSANISGAMGETQTRQFGDNVAYDKVMVLAGDAPPIDEYSVLWVDVAPELDSTGATTTPYDYIVKKVAKSLNSVSIAISKVNVQ